MRENEFNPQEIQNKPEAIQYDPESKEQKARLEAVKSKFSEISNAAMDELPGADERNNDYRQWFVDFRNTHSDFYEYAMYRAATGSTANKPPTYLDTPEGEIERYVLSIEISE